MYKKISVGIELFSHVKTWNAAEHVTKDDLYLLLKEITNSYCLIVSE